MRKYIPNWEQYGIDKNRYLELLHMCRQYPLWKQKLQDLTGIQEIKMDGQPHGSGVSDPVAALVEKRERYIKKILLIDRCALDIDEGLWSRALIQNICYGQIYDSLDRLILPSLNRSEFFKRKKQFFLLLNERAEKGG